MKLFFSPASPYACKVMAVASELGLASLIELQASSASPVKCNMTIAEHNPSGMVPTLLTETDGAIFDSHVICDYLGARVPGNHVVPAAGPTRWQAMREEAIADSLLDAALLARYEMSLRPPDLRWPEWREGQMAKVRRALARIEQLAPAFDGRADLGTLAIACALGYLDARFPDLQWRQDHPQAGVWYDGFGQRPSLTYASWST